MPDQGSAATEHSIIQEITGPLATLPDDPVAEVVEPDFPVVLRGYDRVAVDAYVQRTSQLVAELQATRSPEAAVRRALERVGEQISGILQRAHQTAEEITAQSRREAEDRLERAREEAADVEAAAERRVRELDLETDRIWSERHRIVDEARDLAQQLLAVAQNATERFSEPEAKRGVAAEGWTAEREPEPGIAPAGGPAGAGPAPSAGQPGGAGPARSASEPLDAGSAPSPGEPFDADPTVAFGADDEDPTEPQGERMAPPRPGEHRRSVIPPASDAAARRSES